MDERIVYFGTPKQVKFWDINGNHYIGGIAFCGEIICGCCGGVFDLDEFYEDFDTTEHPEGIEPIIPMDWVDISTEIIGV